MNWVTKRILFGLLSGALLLTAMGCGNKQDPQQGSAGNAIHGTVTASGSTALLPLAQAAKEQFESLHEQVTVNISGGGSFNGLTQVASGAVQIGNSDIAATGDAATGLVEHKVAVSPFVIIINKDVAANNVSMEQLARILKGEITNWKDVGGSDAGITVVSRQQSSGSRATIVAKVLKGQGDMAANALVQDSNGKVLEVVATTPGAVGYVDSAYYRTEKVNALLVEGTAYSPEAVTSGKWPIWAFGYMYTKGEPMGAVKSFLDFILSKEFQESAVEQLGFVPVTKMPKE